MKMRRPWSVVSFPWLVGTACFALFIALLGGGCIGNRPANSAVQGRATDVDPQRANPDYWLAKPAVVRVEADNFDQLWGALREESRSRFFRIDRLDERAGVMTTEAMVSKQFFELWRRDAVTVPDIANSSLQTFRRTVRFQVTRQGDTARYVVEPKVLVEKYDSAEHRITGTSQYHSAFTPTDVEKIEPDYWFAVGRDEALERDLADSVRGRLQ